MSDYLAIAIAWLILHPHWASFTVFLINVSESLVVIGLFVPGTLVMFGIGALVALGAMGLWQTLIWAVAGAIVGDGVSYLIGRHYREQLRTLWPFNRHPEWLARAERFFQRHGGKSVVFGRFAGPVRPIIPAVAGMMGMPAWRFYLVNCLSAITWAPAHILPGVIFGASLSLASKVGTRLMLLLALVLVLTWLIWVSIRRGYGLLQPRTQRMILRLLAWSNAHPHLRSLTAGLFDAEHPEIKALIELGAALLFAGGLFFTNLLDQLRHPDPHSLDYQVYALFQGLRHPWADQVMVAIAAFGDLPANLAVMGAVLIGLLLRRHWLAAGHWLAAVSVAALLGIALNHLLPLSHPRPDLYTGALNLAFPSAHALMVSSLYGFLAVLLARELPPELRRLPYSITGVWILLIVLSHLYLARHWVSDVVGGITLGLAWSGLLGIAYRRHAHKPIGVSALVLLPLLAVISIGGGQAIARHDADLVRYALHHPQRNWQAADWWNRDWTQLPAFRIDDGGTHTAPLSLQYAGDLDILRDQLEIHGWETPPPLNLAALLLLLSPNPALADLPVLPQAHDGRHEALLLIRCLPVTNAPATRLVLRLYAADTTLIDTNQSVWVGTLTRQHYAPALGLINLPQAETEPDILRGLESAVQDFSWRVVARHIAKSDLSILLLSERDSQ